VKSPFHRRLVSIARARETVLTTAAMHIAQSTTLRRYDFFFGIFAPRLRASDSPIAIACFLLVTFFPERPLLNVPALRSFNAFLTFLCAKVFAPDAFREVLIADLRVVVLALPMDLRALVLRDVDLRLALLRAGMA
jgi:hypothetical protein